MSIYIKITTGPISIDISHLACKYMLKKHIWALDERPDGSDYKKRTEVNAITCSISRCLACIFLCRNYRPSCKRLPCSKATCERTCAHPRPSCHIL